MVSTHFKLGRPVGGKSTVVRNLYYPKTQKCNHHPRRPSFYAGTPSQLLDNWIDFHASRSLRFLYVFHPGNSSFQRLHNCIEFNPFSEFLSCPYRSMGKNKFYNRLLCLTTFTVSKFCAIWIRWLWKKCPPGPPIGRPPIHSLIQPSLEPWQLQQRRLDTPLWICKDNLSLTKETDIAIMACG